MLESKLGGALKKTLATGVVAAMMTFGSVSYGKEKPIVYLMNVPVNSGLSKLEKNRMFEFKILEQYHYFDDQTSYVLNEEKQQEYIPNVLEVKF